jgi:acyl-CoA synthetase (AMP-forming)/AMP-acid ligase II
LDEEGFLYVEGRMDDTIIRGAENIAPAEIEDVLLRHPDVLDAVVVGVPDEEWGQRIEAVVVARPGSGLDVEGAAGRLPGHAAQLADEEVGASLRRGGGRARAVRGPSVARGTQSERSAPSGPAVRSPTLLPCPDRQCPTESM